MNSPLLKLTPDDNLWEAHQMMERLQNRRLVVCDPNNALVETVQSDVLSKLDPDPIEMQKTISALRQQIDILQDERVQWLHSHASHLESIVQSTEQRFQAIFNQTFQFMGLLDPDGTLLEINQTALEFCAVKREEVINRPFWEAPCWQHSLQYQQQLKDAIARAAQGEFIRYEAEIHGAHQATTIDFSLRPIFDAAGQVTLLIPEGRDIGEYKRAEAAKKLYEQRLSNLAEAAPVGIFQTDALGNCQYVNGLWCEIAEMTPKEAKGQGWINGIHPEDRDLVWSEWERSTQESQPFRLEYRFQTTTGKVTWVYGQSVTETDANGEVTGHIGTITDITDRKQAEFELKQLNQSLEERVQCRTAELRASQQRYRLLYRKTPVMLHSTDQQGYLCTISDHWLNRLGYEVHEVIGHKFSDFLTPESREYEETVVFPEYLATGSIFEAPYQVLCKDGEVIDVLLSATREPDISGKQISLAIMVDITKRKQVEQELFREKELAQVTLHSIGDAVITTNALGQVEYMNPVAEILTGWCSTHAIGKRFHEVFQVIHDTTRQVLESPIERVLTHGQIASQADHTVLVSRDGQEYYIEDSAAPIRDRSKQIIGVVVVFHDVTESRRISRQLTWQASHDTLTHLVNRRQFESILSEALQDISREHKEHVLCYLDLDQFKVVNDTCGHIAGDELLRQVSQLLKSKIRAVDTLARLGGDEFGILLKQCPLEHAVIIADKLRQAIQEFRFIWNNKAFRIGVSIGLVFFDSDNSTLPEILSNADSACYVAKEKGRNCIHIYKPNDSEVQKQRGERRWSIRIQQALEENRFCLYRQTIAQTTVTEPYRHYEILLRMIDEQGELVPPGAFIPAAERYNLMSDIDRWVVKTFFAFVQESRLRLPQCQHLNPESLYFINLSGASVGDASFLNFLKQALSRYEISPQTVGFEITETAAIANLDQASLFIRELKQLGCLFALDDFGSGLSSFGYLKKLPVDFLKIDGKFILDMTESPANYAIVESINHIGHILGLKTVAEYVENQTIRDNVIKMGMDYMQGYGIDRPSPI